jgi:hypothetical protein
MNQKNNKLTIEEIDNWVTDHLRYCINNGFPEGIDPEKDVIAYTAGLFEGYCSAAMYFNGLDELPENCHLEKY